MAQHPFLRMQSRVTHGSKGTIRDVEGGKKIVRVEANSKNPPPPKKLTYEH